MQAYSAYCKNGQIIPVGNPKIPEGCKIILTILDDSVIEREIETQKRIEALDEFFTTIESSDEDVPDFERVKFCREVDL